MIYVYFLLFQPVESLVVAVLSLARMVFGSWAEVRNWRMGRSKKIVEN